MGAALATFLEILEQGPSAASFVFNPWRDWDQRDRTPQHATPKLRLENLSAYLEARLQSARVMLMGEAPSHRGCRFTGIAFCSEVELRQKVDLVAPRPLELTSRDAVVKPQRERSAAVIWEELERCGRAFEIVLWNAFPWHPYRAPAKDGQSVVGPCGPTSNRRPRIAEVDHGRAALGALLACLPRELEILAVGKVAEEALARWDEVKCSGYIRHPAQGGEGLFRTQFRRQIAARLR